jgi:hypothetical protein
MAKKKQLAGKKTKLAKLPLTQALAGQTEEPAPWGPPPGPPPVAARQLPWTPEEAAAVYLQLVQELTALKSQLQPGSARVPPPPPGLAPLQMPPPHQIIGVLRQAREGLQDLQRLLS